MIPRTMSPTKALPCGLPKPARRLPGLKSRKTSPRYDLSGDVYAVNQNKKTVIAAAAMGARICS
jgi:hypothetical protein